MGWRGSKKGIYAFINDRIGTDRGVVIRRGKNLTGSEGTTDLDQLCTMAKGVGFDGITHEGYVMSPLAEKYDQYYPKSLNMMMLRSKQKMIQKVMTLLRKHKQN